jgi:dephospho-CoA kinase
MLRIGITGGIGTGKTTVCKMFEKLGVPVYYADDRAKWINNNDTEVITALKSTFGEDIYQNGILNRSKLGEIVFSDKEKLEKLNTIVHPVVFRDAEQWQQEKQKAGFYYTLKEAALLFETGSYKQLDKIIVVSAMENIRIERVMKRDNLSREEVLKRISKQMPQSEKEKAADFIIENSSMEAMETQVLELHEKILNLAKSL